MRNVLLTIPLLFAALASTAHANTITFSIDGGPAVLIESYSFEIDKTVAIDSDDALLNRELTMAAVLGTHFADMFLTFYNSNTNLIYRFDLADDVVTHSSPSPMGGGVDQIDIAYDTVTETVSSTVPEPSSVMLALAALVALAVAARKRASRTRGA
jgi:hypothetical protein